MLLLRLQRGQRIWAVLAAGGGGTVLWVMLVLLALGVATKVPCLVGSSHGAPPRLCYSDITALFGERSLGKHLFPYVNGRYIIGPTGNAFLSPGEIEYPVLTGLFAWVTSLPEHTAQVFLITNMLMLAPFGAVSAWLLWRLAGHRALLFAGAPAVAFYAFLNWDLVAVAWAMGGIYLWSRRRPYVAAAMFALGGCFKVWPAFFLLPLALDLLATGERREAVMATMTGVGVVLVVNVPFLALSPRGWYAPYAFQADWAEGRRTNSLWYWEARGLSTHSVDVLSSVVVLAGFLVIGAMAWRTARRKTGFPFVQACAAMVCWYLVAGKVDSPQYDLWVLPFFALLSMRRGVWVQFVMADAAVYSWSLFAITELSRLLFAIVLWRAGVLIWAMVSAWRAEPAFVEGAGKAHYDDAIGVGCLEPAGS
jgi:uncharacterized membrane protein